MGIKALCSDLFYEILETVIPNRTKRLIMISSLCPVVAKKDLNDEYLALLNTQLSLCREEDALKLPLTMSQSIWSKVPIEDEEIEKNPGQVAQRIVTNVPEWLKYDKDTVILDEIQSLLRFNSYYHNQHDVEEALRRL